MNDNKNRRKLRSRAKTRGTGLCPRLSVFRSNKYLSAQIIDDEKGETLIGFSGKSLTEGKKAVGKNEQAKLVGAKIAEMALAKKIKKVVFDRSGYQYHGLVKSLADSAREKGLEF